MTLVGAQFSSVAAPPQLRKKTDISRAENEDDHFLLCQPAQEKHYYPFAERICVCFWPCLDYGFRKMLGRWTRLSNLDAHYNDIVTYIHMYGECSSSEGNVFSLCLELCKHSYVL
jgi:hypothetical protein